MSNKKVHVETIDMTPTWSQAVNIYMACLENGDNENAKEAARSELRRMARIADAFTAQQKTIKTHIDGLADKLRNPRSSQGKST